MQDPVQEEPTLAAGTLCGTYVIEGMLGRGGMGAVYRARHQAIGQAAAVKVLLAAVAGQPGAAERFFAEARLVSQLGHPGLVRIFDYGRLSSGAFYLTMELLAGETLRARVSGGPRPLAEALDIGWQVADALAAVHAAGVIHRDLKPENLQIIPDPVAPRGERVKILDFGIAKQASGGLGLSTSPGLTTEGRMLGTPLYMAPEQCEGVAVTAAVDVYALGIVLYELCAGGPPFSGPSGAAVLAQHILQAPTPLGERAPGVPPSLAALVHAMLAKAPAERPAMADVAAALRELRTRGEGSGVVALGNLPAVAGGGNAASAVLSGAARPLGGAGPQALITAPGAPVTAMGMTPGAGTVHVGRGPGGVPRALLIAAPLALVIFGVTLAIALRAPGQGGQSNRGTEGTDPLARAPARPAVMAAPASAAPTTIAVATQGTAPHAGPAEPSRGARSAHAHRASALAASASAPAVADPPTDDPAAPQPHPAAVAPAPPRQALPAGGAQPRGAPSIDALGLRVAAQAARAGVAGKPHTPLLSGYGHDGQEQRVTVQLTAGACYTFVSSGGGGMRALYAYLWDTRRKRVATDKADQDSVISYCARASGPHLYLVKAAGGDGPFRSVLYGP